MAEVTDTYILNRVHEVTTWVGATIGTILGALAVALPSAAGLPSPWNYIAIATAILLVVAPGGPKIVR